MLNGKQSRNRTGEIDEVIPRRNYFFLFYLIIDVYRCIFFSSCFYFRKNSSFSFLYVTSTECSSSQMNNFKRKVINVFHCTHKRRQILFYNEANAKFGVEISFPFLKIYTNKKNDDPGSAAKVQESIYISALQILSNSLNWERKIPVLKMSFN